MPEEYHNKDSIPADVICRIEEQHNFVEWRLGTGFKEYGRIALARFRKNGVLVGGPFSKITELK